MRERAAALLQLGSGTARGGRPVRCYAVLTARVRARARAGAAAGGGGRGLPAALLRPALLARGARPGALPQAGRSAAGAVVCAPGAPVPICHVRGTCADLLALLPECGGSGCCAELWP